MPVPDSYFNDVSLLLPMDGADGSTSFPDRSNNALTVTNVGTGTTISRSVFRYNGASASFNGATNNYLTVPTAGGQFDFGSNNFTIECWIRPSSLPATSQIVGVSPSGGNYSWRLLTGTTALYFEIKGGGVSQSINSSTGLLATNTWYHVAAVRNGTNISIYLNGNSVVSSTTSITALNNAGSLLNIGRNEDTNTWYYSGHIDDLRITKNIARYTSAFTPPTALWDIIPEGYVIINGAEGGASLTRRFMSITAESGANYLVGGGTGVCPPCPPSNVRPTEGLLYPRREG